MALAFLDYIMVFISAFKEKRKIEKGNEINANLPSNIADKVALLENKAINGDINAAYKLGKMYLDADEVGYDPKKGEYYFEIAARQDDFDANYALALYYKGYWSYQHSDAYKSFIKYIVARNCKTDDKQYIDEVNRAINEDFIKIDDTIMFKNDIAIK